MTLYSIHLGSPCPQLHIVFIPAVNEVDPPLGGRASRLDMQSHNALLQLSNPLVPSWTRPEYKDHPKLYYLLCSTSHTSASTV